MEAERIVNFMFRIERVEFGLRGLSVFSTEVFSFAFEEEMAANRPENRASIHFPKD